MCRHPALCLIFVFGLVGCQGATSPGTESSGSIDADVTDAGPIVIGDLPTASFAVEADLPTTIFGSTPFPSNIYHDEMGRVDLRGFPHQTGGSVIERVVQNIRDEGGGFGTAATLYIPVDGPIPAAALPARAADSLAADSSLLLVDVDPASPEYGRRFPINHRVEGDQNLYLPPHTLKVRVVEGLALRPNTRYAIALTTAAAHPAEGFLATMTAERPEGHIGAVWDIHQPLRDWADETGVSLATGTVFTTQDPIGDMLRLRNFTHALPTPAVAEFVSRGQRLGLFELFVGKYVAPRFQEGELPFLAPGSGAIRFDAMGQPIVQGEETIRFALSIPLEGEMPPDGWPVVLYGHGTGGNYESFVSAKVAVTLARAGIAVLSIDQIHHGFRDQRPDGCHTSVDPGSCVSLLFFNFLIPTAGRDNVRQSAIDFVTLLKVARSFEYAVLEPNMEVDTPAQAVMPNSDAGIEADLGVAEIVDGSMEPDALLPSPADSGVLDATPPVPDSASMMISDAGLTPSDGTVDAGDPEIDATLDVDAGDPVPSRIIKLDGSRVIYMGHSQGGINGPLFLAIEPDVKAGVLSAAGATLAISLEQKTKPTDINELVSSFVPVFEEGAIDRWHPVLSLMQTFIEPGDPVNYAHLWFHEPPEGAQARHIFMTAGLGDEYTPPESIFALAAAGRVPIIEPVREPIELYEILGIEPAGIPPYSGNVASGRASAGLVQLPNTGHFAIQRDITLRNRYRRFIESVFAGDASIY